MLKKYSRQIVSLLIAWGVLLAVLLSASPSTSGYLYADEKYYPAIIKLEKTDAGFRAYLGKNFLVRNADGYPLKRPTLVFDTGGGWRHGEPHFCGRGHPTCLPRDHKEKYNIPPIALSRKEAVTLRPSLKTAKDIEQEVGPLTEHEDLIWFGISFYYGEGTSGVGGVGRYDPKKEQMEIRRPHILLDSSINNIAHDGESLWLGTAGSKSGYFRDVPQHGLIRYNWDTDKSETFEGKDGGPCGFVVHDLLLDNNYLWTATELGLSRWDLQAMKWEHFIPDPTSVKPMRKTTCNAVYTNLLKSLPRTPINEPVILFDTYYEQLFNALARFRPSFLNKYVKTLPPAQWQCEEIRFLAKNIADFTTLEDSLLKVSPIGSPHFWCMIDEFSNKKSRDPRWRNLLVETLRTFIDVDRSHDEHELKYTLYPLLKMYPEDAEIGELLARRLKTARRPYREAKLLPFFLGRKSVPHLIKALDHKDLVSIEGEVLDALMNTTGQYISPNGTIRRIPSDSDPESYEVSRKARKFVIEHWKKWWKTHKADYTAKLNLPPRSKRLEIKTKTGTKAIDPVVTLSASSATLPLGASYTLKAVVNNQNSPKKPLLKDFALSFKIREGPHKDLVKTKHGVTDSNGEFTFSYYGNKTGTDEIEVTHDGDDIFMDDGYAEVSWMGPDLVVNFFSPPLIMATEYRTLIVDDVIENIGKFTSVPSMTRYYLSPTPDIDTSEAIVIGERIVPSLKPRQENKIHLKIMLPGNLKQGSLYFIGACADATKKVMESEEKNNCSFNEVKGHINIITPAIQMNK